MAVLFGMAVSVGAIAHDAAPAGAVANVEDGCTGPRSRIVYGTGELWVADGDASNRRLIRGGQTGRGPYNPALSHDGKRVAYMYDFQIFAIDVDGTNERNLAGWQANLPFWSLDDSRVYYTAFNGLGSRIGWVNVDGVGGGVFPAPAGASDSGGDWSPDGTRLAFASDRAGGHGVFTALADGSDVMQVVDGALDAGDPLWSPDGSRIAFTALSSQGEGFSVYVVNADGTGLTHLRSRAIAETWSPDGRIVFRAPDDLRLSTMRPDGTQVAPLAADPGIDGGADWRRVRRGSVSVSAGGAHTLGLHADGTVWAWGYNGYGQLGVPALPASGSVRPVPVPGLGDVGCISAGALHTLAADASGNAWAWGWNGAGQLGVGSTADARAPARVSLTVPVKAVSAGTYHSLALGTDGTVWAWGWNGVGQLGDGTATTRLQPVRVVGLSSVVAISAGFAHSLALRDDGTVWAWGWNTAGQLGTGSASDSALPRPVIGLQDVAAISAGGVHSLAAKSDSSVWAWGHNGYGQLGIGTTVNANAPKLVGGLSATSVAAGFVHSVATDAVGRVFGWGYNAFGMVGDGTSTTRTVPRPASGLRARGSVTAGLYHTLSVANPEMVRAWGHNGQGQLGTAGASSTLVPAAVVGLPTSG